MRIGGPCSGLRRDAGAWVAKVVARVLWQVVANSRHKAWGQRPEGIRRGASGGVGLGICPVGKTFQERAGAIQRKLSNAVGSD